MREELRLRDVVVEHMHEPVGLDIHNPRFGWKLVSTEKGTHQTACRVQIRSEGKVIRDTGSLATARSVDLELTDWTPEPMTEYQVHVEVWDNHGRRAEADTRFESGRMGVPFAGSWIEPEQEPTPESIGKKKITSTSVAENTFRGVERDFAEFRPVQLIRIPFSVTKPVKRARVYATAHGVYQLNVNGAPADGRLFAPEATTYHKHLLYQTYDVTAQLAAGENVFGVMLADGWWAGRIGTTGDCCQYGTTTGLLFEARITWQDGTTDIVNAEQARSATGPFRYSDLFVGEYYDATKEIPGWDLPGFDASGWKPVRIMDYGQKNIAGQYAPPVHCLRIMEPERIITTPAGETLADFGQVIAGAAEISLAAPAGVTIRLEHSEVLDENGNYFNNILGVNKEQTDTYITKEGFQTYRPYFTYHGFRYIRVTGWPGELTTKEIRAYVYTSRMDNIGSFTTSDERLNRLQENIWWSQVANTVSIPTDCPQREKAGWTGDIMAFAPTLCFNRNADAFLTSWLDNLRLDQTEAGEVPNIIPFWKAYGIMWNNSNKVITSCGWGDACIIVPYTLYRTYGDERVLRENYGAMKKWLSYIESRMHQHHPEEYATWDEARRKRSYYLWNTDFHYGDWLIPSMVLGNPDAGCMKQTAYATMHVVAPAYAAFSASHIAEIADILGEKEDARYYRELYDHIREAFIAEYVHEDGTMAVDFQGIYVIALKNNLVTDEIRPRMTAHLCELIRQNGDCLDTGFLSVLFLMDVLCENGCRDVAHKLLFQTACPGWLYEVEHGATTMWESWGAIGEDGTVSTYSYNHYAFGCIGEWLYREIGGLQAAEPGYKKIRIAPDLYCGLTHAAVSEDTPYGTASAEWEILGEHVVVHVTIPPNTRAEICLPGMDPAEEESGSFRYVVKL